MQTSFTNVQLADPTIARADAILRRCIHCGLCTATCPTYVLTGDERDSPRGRIYFMKQMFEEREVTPSMTYHIDRCLSCFSCMTTCPSGVDYMHLVDLARVRAGRRKLVKTAKLTRPRSAIGKDPKAKRVALMLGCVQEVLAPSISLAAIRLLRRHGVDVVVLKDETCCGALPHHLGRGEGGRPRARRTIDYWPG